MQQVLLLLLVHSVATDVITEVIVVMTCGRLRLRLEVHLGKGAGQVQVLVCCVYLMRRVQS